MFLSKNKVCVCQIDFPNAHHVDSSERDPVAFETFTSFSFFCKMAYLN